MRNTCSELKVFLKISINLRKPVFIRADLEPLRLPEYSHDQIKAFCHSKLVLQFTVTIHLIWFLLSLPLCYRSLRKKNPTTNQTRQLSYLPRQQAVIFLNREDARSQISSPYFCMKETKKQAKIAKCVFNYKLRVHENFATINLATCTRKMESN